jgi:DNA-binding SARP family transcriptional activator
LTTTAPGQAAAVRAKVKTDLRLDLIDGFALTAGGRDVQLPLGTCRMLAFLALHDRAMQRSHVAGSLWFNTDEEKAGACLRSALWRVNRTGLDVVDSSDGSLGLASGVSVDAREAAGAAAGLADGLPATRPDGALIRMFSHDLLPDWYDDWAIVARERFRQVRLHALEKLCDRLWASGDPARAIEAGLAAVAGEPLRESAHRALMRAHLAEGNYVEAERQYRFYEELVVRELGVSPSQRIRDLL